jgi:outer membrane murein-binding lipoprotein Lpp
MRGERTREDLSDEVGQLRDRVRLLEEDREVKTKRLKAYELRAARAEALLNALADVLIKNNSG